MFPALFPANILWPIMLSYWRYWHTWHTYTQLDFWTNQKVCDAVPPSNCRCPPIIKWANNFCLTLHWTDQQLNPLKLRQSEMVCVCLSDAQSLHQLFLPFKNQIHIHIFLCVVTVCFMVKLRYQSSLSFGW